MGTSRWPHSEFNGYRIFTFNVILTALTLTHKATSQRQVVDPDFPKYSLEFVKSWGWPLAFIYYLHVNPLRGKI